MFRSGSTHPRAIAVDAEPSSTSAFQGLVRIVATTIKIGTGGRSGPARARTFSTPTAAPSYSQSTNSGSVAGHGWRRLSALHFLGGCRLPWPTSCCLERSTPFYGIWWAVDSGTSAPAFGSSRIASSDYQKWPTGHCPHSVTAGPRRLALGRPAALFTDSKFEIASRWNVCPESEIIGFTRWNCSRVPAILREISEGASY